MIEARKSPNVIAARALVNSARGHAYWSNFDHRNIELIERKAQLIYTAIFEPEDATPHTDTELQSAGSAQTANGLRLALELVNTINDIKGNTTPDIDTTGVTTARFIDKTYGVVKYMSGKDAALLNLHPAVYFWGSTGNHRPSIFLAVASFVQELIKNDELIKFTLHRARFENS